MQLAAWIDNKIRHALVCVMQSHAVGENLKDLLNISLSVCLNGNAES
jgi:hypothetical protein